MPGLGSARHLPISQPASTQHPIGASAQHLLSGVGRAVGEARCASRFAWGSRLLPTLGRPGGQSQFRQLTKPPRNRVSSILRSGLGLSGDPESAASRTLKRQYFPQSLREGPHQRRLRPTQSVNRQDQAHELARARDAGGGALCWYPRASGLITPIRYRISCTVISSIIIHHPSSIHHQRLRHKTFSSRIHSRFPISSNSPVHSGLRGLVALVGPRHSIKLRCYFQLPALHPILIISISLCSGPVYRRLGVTASPHSRQARWPESVSSIDETPTKQGFVNPTERIRVIWRSRERGKPHTQAPVLPPVSTRGAAPEAFASHSEREQTGSGSRACSCA